MAAHHILAVDLGASSGRVIHGAWDGRRFALAEVHRFTNAPVLVSGALRWDVLRLWSEITSGIERFAASQQPLMSIGVDTWGVDYALLDAHGQLLSNPFCYRDTRTQGVEAELFAAAPAAQIFGITGVQFLPINTINQLFSQRADPQLQIAQSLLLMPDLFHYWLSGVQANEYTAASTTQLVDARHRVWSSELIGALGLPPQIFRAALTQPGTVLGALSRQLRGELGISGPAQVSLPATHDTASAVVAVPGLDPRSAYISSGTWSLVGIETEQPVLTPTAQALNVTNEGGFGGTIRLLRNVMGLWLVQECRNQWRRAGREWSWEELLTRAEQATPLHSLIDPDAPELLAPGDMPARIRARCAATGQPVPADEGALIRCCLESLALRYRWVIDRLSTLTGRPIETIRVVGGGAQNRLLCQLTADACGRALIAGPVEATALGNLLVQAIGAGLLPDLASARAVLAESVTLSHYEPRGGPEWAAAYDRFCTLVR
jgi:rhamnulokinase